MLGTRLLLPESELAMLDLAATDSNSIRNVLTGDRAYRPYQ